MRIPHTEVSSMMTTTSEPQWVGIDVSQEWLDIALRPAGTHWRCPVNKVLCLATEKPRAI